MVKGQDSGACLPGLKLPCRHNGRVTWGKPLHLSVPPLPLL